MGEIIVQRDERNRIVSLTGQGLQVESPAAMNARYFIQAAVAAMIEYLHLNPVYHLEEEMLLSLDRRDPHLDREIDAILETLLIGLKLLAKEYPGDIVLHEATVELKV